ncbi:hypothetical protein ES705_42051 [subsurface metagenome]
MGWIVIPFLVLIFYIYITEIQKARKSGNWDVIICGQAFCPECSNGRIFECCSSYICDSCLDKVEIEEECPDCGESLYKCPGCNSIYCIGCDEIKKNHKIQDLSSIEKK